MQLEAALADTTRRAERQQADLADAIAEIHASVFSEISVHTDGELPGGCGRSAGCS